MLVEIVGNQYKMLARFVRQLLLDPIAPVPKCERSIHCRAAGLFREAGEEDGETHRNHKSALRHVPLLPKMEQTFYGKNIDNNGRGREVVRLREKTKRDCQGGCQGREKHNTQAALPEAR
jgi:hypothetical protein